MVYSELYGFRPVLHSGRKCNQFPIKMCPARIGIGRNIFLPLGILSFYMAGHTGVVATATLQVADCVLCITHISFIYTVILWFYGLQNPIHCATGNRVSRGCPSAYGLFCCHSESESGENALISYGILQTLFQGQRAVQSPIIISVLHSPIPTPIHQ